MKSREIPRSKIGPFPLACTDPYVDTGWEYQSKGSVQYYPEPLQEHIDLVTRIAKVMCFSHTWSSHCPSI